MKPLYERVLVKPREKQTTTDSGLMLPEKAVKRPNIATVVACGDGNANNPMKVKAGDIVLCNRFAGAELKYKGEMHYMIMSNEIMCILDNVEDIELEEYS